MGRKADENKVELALILYMNGKSNKDIADQLGVNEKTIGVWAEKLGWKERKAAVQISRTEITNGLLKKLADMLEKGEINADEVSKIASSIEKLDKEQGNLFYVITTFMDFGKWLNKLVGVELSSDEVKLIVRLQDRYIQEKI